MLDIVVQGTLHRAPREGVGATGAPFVAATIRAHAYDKKPVLLNVIAHRAIAREALVKLAVGDEVALVGGLTPRTNFHDGKPRWYLDVSAHTVLTGKRLARLRQSEGSDAQPVFVYLGESQAEVRT